MAKEEECRQCTKCKVSSYGALKCSFYGRLPEFNDSSCSKFNQREISIESPKVKQVFGSIKKEPQVKDQSEQEEYEGPICYHGAFAGDIYPDTEKPFKEVKKKKRFSPSRMLFMVALGMIIAIVSGSRHTSRNHLTYNFSSQNFIFDDYSSIMWLFCLAFFTIIVFFTYIYVFYRVGIISRPYKERLQPFYHSLVKINTGSIVRHLFVFQILFSVILGVRGVVLFKIFSGYDGIAIGWYDWLSILGLVFLVLLMLNMLFLSIRLFQMKKRSFAMWIVGCIFALLMLQVVPMFGNPYIAIVAMALFDVWAIIGASAIIDSAEKAFFTETEYNPTKEVEESI